MKWTRISDLQAYSDFITLKEPIQFKGFKAIGYFPYEKAQLDYNECAAVPRSVFTEVEVVLSRTIYMDNKTVFVFEDETNFGTEDFCIQFKDSYCKVGKLDHVRGYAGRELTKKSQKSL
jgi:hypothetical protein